MNYALRWSNHRPGLDIQRRKQHIIIRRQPAAARTIQAQAARQSDSRRCDWWGTVKKRLGMSFNLADEIGRYKHLTGAGINVQVRYLT